MFKAVTSSVKLAQENSVVVSSANKIGMDDLFIMSDHYIYKRKLVVHLVSHFAIQRHPWYNYCLLKLFDIYQSSKIQSTFLP
jgi:hypothetical protein